MYTGHIIHHSEVSVRSRIGDGGGDHDDGGGGDGDSDGDNEDAGGRRGTTMRRDLGLTHPLMMCRTSTETLATQSFASIPCPPDVSVVLQVR